GGRRGAGAETGRRCPGNGLPDYQRSVAVGLVAEALAGVRIVAEALHAEHQGVSRREWPTQSHRTGETLRAESEPRLTGLRIGLCPEPHCDTWPTTVQLGAHAHAGAEGRTRQQQTRPEGERAEVGHRSNLLAANESPIPRLIQPPIAGRAHAAGWQPYCAARRRLRARTRRAAS